MDLYISRLPTFGEVRRRAMREKRVIMRVVLMADDTPSLVRFGPRGGWRAMRMAAPA